MADPIQPVSPQFVGRYPGAPNAVPAPAAPSRFVSRLPVGAPGTTSGAVPTVATQNLPSMNTATIGQPIDTAALNAATQGAPVQPLPVMQPSAQAVAQTAAVPAAAPAAAAPAVQQDATAPTPIADTRTRVVLPAAFNAANVTPPGGGVMGSTPAVGGSGQIGPFRDPTGVISAGYDRQQAYGDHFMRQALDYISGGNDIFEQATRGRAIAGILHAVAGQNNEGTAQASGANSLNSSIAGLEGASLGAQSQMYNADSNVLAGQQRNATSENVARMDLQGRTVQTGQTSSVDGNGIYTTYSNFAQPQVGGGMVTLKPLVPTPRQAAAPKLVENATSTDMKTGKPIIVKNGQWVAQ